MIFEAVDHLAQEKQLFNELKQRKKDFQQYIRDNMGKVNIPYTEENYHILCEEANRLKDEVIDLGRDVDDLQNKNF